MVPRPGVVVSLVRCEQSGIDADLQSGMNNSLESEVNRPDLLARRIARCPRAGAEKNVVELTKCPGEI